jgi:hypothetical protein
MAWLCGHGNLLIGPETLHGCLIDGVDLLGMSSLAMQLLLI